ncbi:MAG TPA: GNAT family N-acetyltransferase [Chloroflexota bacterium]|nr:GNAT family N-acetyltransferase [Chloroflexota bacterium]
MDCPTLTLRRLGDFSSLELSWRALLPRFAGDTIFLTWEWQRLWWQHCAEGELHLLTIQADDELVGIAPLLRLDGRWGFAGGVEVADFLDVIALPGHAASVASAVLDYLQHHGGDVDLRNLRPDSIGATRLLEEARRRGIAATIEQEDVSPRVELPKDWDDYLQFLSKKDRHELRRKLRRLLSSGDVRYAVANDPATRGRDVDDFIRLHRLSAPEKASFMTPEMARFFHALVEEFAPSGLLRLYFLEVDRLRVAAVVLFDYGGEFLLYNSGYDPAHAHLSAGLLLKALCLRDAIDEGRRTFDFLQGDEPYKYDLGATNVPILRLRLEQDGSDRRGVARGDA